MLTRLKVDGFKNLNGLDVRFGPFTCVAGPNGVGKSNLFDAISFLSALASRPLMEAALAVRGGETQRGDVQSLFYRTAGEVSDRMRFLVEFIIPKTGEDELNQPATASMTFLRYELELRYRAGDAIKSLGGLEIAHESMVHINKSEAAKQLWFPHKAAWRASAIIGRRSSDYISTDNETGEAIVALHADSEAGGGRPRRLPAKSLPRTMLSSANNAAEHRTLVLARQEMMRWTQLQLEPSALRVPDELTAEPSLDPTGRHLPATLYALAHRAEREKEGGADDVYAQVANRLSQLIENVGRVRVDVDEKRRLMSIVMTDRAGTEHVASALSDGTLRFLALTVMEADPKGRSLLCLEEPENGMHPQRIAAVIELLQDLAVDVTMAVDEDNPLKQVIINTHSPSVVGAVPEDALLVAQVITTVRGSSIHPRFVVRGLSRTWRDRGDEPMVTKGELLAYLNPLAGLTDGHVEQNEPHPKSTRRVIQRPDVQQLLLFYTGKPVS